MGATEQTTGALVFVPPPIDPSRILLRREAFVPAALVSASAG
jgi:hypothetical protein